MNFIAKRRLFVIQKQTTTRFNAVQYDDLGSRSDKNNPDCGGAMIVTQIPTLQTDSPVRINDLGLPKDAPLAIPSKRSETFMAAVGDLLRKIYPGATFHISQIIPEVAASTVLFWEGFDGGQLERRTELFRVLDEHFLDADLEDSAFILAFTSRERHDEMRFE